MLLVMDYMEGGPVMTRDALERGRCIPESLALQYFRDMCKVILTSPGRTCLSYHVSSSFAAQGCCQGYLNEASHLQADTILLQFSSSKHLACLLFMLLVYDNTTTQQSMPPMKRHSNLCHQ